MGPRVQPDGHLAPRTAGPVQKRRPYWARRHHAECADALHRRGHPVGLFWHAPCASIGGAGIAVRQNRRGDHARPPQPPPTLTRVGGSGDGHRTRAPGQTGGRGGFECHSIFIRRSKYKISTIQFILFDMATFAPISGTCAFVSSPRKSRETGYFIRPMIRIIEKIRINKFRI